MDDYRALLKDTSAMVAALKSIRKDLSNKEYEDLGQLYATTAGVLASRDNGQRIRGDTVYSSSKIGGYLTKYFGGVGCRSPVTPAPKMFQ